MNTIAVLLACIAAVTCNDIQVGSNYGRVIFDQKIQASPAIWRQSQKITINATDQEVISQIMVTDQRPEKDGDAKIIDGGKGQKNVTIELQSPTVFRGFDFHVVIYAVQQDTNSETISMTNDTNVNNSVKPEEADIVDSKTVGNGEISTTAPTTEGKAINEAGKPTPVTTEDQARTNRDTQDQIDPIVQYVETKTTELPELTTFEPTIVQEITTNSAAKVNRLYSHPASIATENKTSHTLKAREEDIPSALPTDISKVDVKIQDELSTRSTPAGSDVTTTTTPQSFRSPATHENFENISKELGKKVIFGYKKH